nr:FCD domain-containing protein [Planctomonas sp. JC2975]
MDGLGLAIVGGDVPPGSDDTVDRIVERTGASRSVVREATRVLVSLGMLTAGRRVGLRVRPRDEWDLLDPQVIRWRLESPDREAQLADLLGLRLVVELEAAARAAAHSTPRETAELRATAQALAGATAARDRDGFFEADRRFHGTVLRLAGNAMLARLAGVVDEALRERVPDDHLRWSVASSGVELHSAVADAIAAGDSDGAARLMRRIVDPGASTRAPQGRAHRVAMVESPPGMGGSSASVSAPIDE